MKDTGLDVYKRQDRHTIAAVYAISHSVDRISSQQHRKGHVLPDAGRYAIQRAGGRKRNPVCLLPCHSHCYRFKIGTIGEKKPEDWVVVEGQHEPLIDRMSFDIVQNKLKSRQRPGQTNEISLFAGLIKCGECGKSLTVRYTNAKHPQRIYSCKTYNCLLYTSHLCFDFCPKNCQ